MAPFFPRELKVEMVYTMGFPTDPIDERLAPMERFLGLIFRAQRSRSGRMDALGDHRIGRYHHPNWLFPVSSAAIAAISSAVSPNPNTSRFSRMRRASADFGMTGMPRCTRKRRPT